MISNIVSKLMDLRENKREIELKRTVHYLSKENKAVVLEWLCLVFQEELENITYSALTAAIKKEFYL